MTLEKQEDIINVFHDGMIIDISNVDKNIMLKIDIPYLATLVSKSYTCFFLELIHCYDFYFKNYDEVGSKNKFNVILSYEPEILYSDNNNIDKLAVDCSTQNGIGGKLFIKSKCIKIYDQNKKIITEDELLKIIDKYWNSKTGSV